MENELKHSEDEVSEAKLAITDISLITTTLKDLKLKLQSQELIRSMGPALDEVLSTLRLAQLAIMDEFGFIPNV